MLPSKFVKNIAHRIVDMKTFEKEIEDGVVMAACEESSIFVQSVSRGTIQRCLITFCHFARASAFVQAVYLFAVTGSIEEQK